MGIERNTFRKLFEESRELHTYVCGLVAARQRRKTEPDNTIGGAEKLGIDTDYNNQDGYRLHLISGFVTIPRNTKGEMLKRAGPFRREPATRKGVLCYDYLSAVMNRVKRSAMLMTIASGGMLCKRTGEFVLVVTLTILIPSAIYARPQPTWARIVGNFCIEGVPMSARRVTATENVNGIAVEQFDVAYDVPQASSLAMMRVFREPPTNSSPLTRCSDLAGDAVLEGRVKKLTIRGARETAAGSSPAYFQIRTDSSRYMDVELTRVKSSLAPLYGGMMQLGREGAIAPSSRAWVRSVGTIESSTGSPNQGALDITTWGRNLRAAKILFPGAAAPTSVDLSAGNSNLVLRVAVDGSRTELRSGSLRAGPTRLAGNSVNLPGGDFRQFDGTAAGLEVIANDAGASVRMTDVSYRSASASLGGREARTTMNNATGTIATIGAATPRSGDVISLADPTVTNLRSAGFSCDHSYASVSLTRAASCAVIVARSDRSSLRAEFKTITPQQSLGSRVLQPTGEVRWTTVASGGPEAITGLLTKADLRAGSLLLRDQTVHVAQPVLEGPEMKIPFSLYATTPWGQWSFNSSQGRAVIGGQLQQLLVRGTVGVPIATPEQWHIRVKRNDFQFAGKIGAALEPHVYGGTPLLAAGAELSFNADSDLTMNALGSRGIMGTGLSVFALTNIDLDVGVGDADLVLRGSSGPISFDGSVRLGYDLASGVGHVQSGRLNMQNLLLETRPGSPGDLGSVRVQAASLHVGRAQAEFRSEQNQGSFGIFDIKLAAGDVKSTPGTGADQLSWAGSLSRPLTIQSVSGKILRKPDSNTLKVADEKIEQLALGISNAKLGQGSELRFGAGRMDLNFPEISRTNIKGTLDLQGAGLYADTGPAEFLLTGLNLAVQLTGGPPEKPNGTGRLRTGPLAVDVDTPITLDFEACDGEPRFRSLPVNIQFASLATDVDLTLTQGQLKGRGQAGVSGSFIKNTGQYECRKRLADWPISKEVRAKYKYPCPTWRKPFRMCNGWTTIVPEIRVGIDRLLRIRHLYAAGIFSAVGLNIDPRPGGGTKFTRCLKRGLFVPVLDVSYFITPKTSIRVADNIIQEIIDLHARPFGSAFASALPAMIGNAQMLDGKGWCI